jgi:hypothetical protein
MLFAHHVCGMALAAVLEKAVMKERNEEPQQQPNDSNLDIPAEANRGKHINFMEAEEESSRKTGTMPMILQPNGKSNGKKDWKKEKKPSEQQRAIHLLNPFTRYRCAYFLNCYPANEKA